MPTSPGERSLLTDDMRAAVGQEFRWVTSFPISANEIRRWAIVLYYPRTPPPLFWDDEYASTTRFGGIVAPEDFNPFAWMTADPRPTPAPWSTVESISARRSWAAESYGSANANLTTPTGAAQPLFSTSTTLAPELALEVRFGVRLVGRLRAEASGCVGRAPTSTRASLATSRARRR